MLLFLLLLIATCIIHHLNKYMYKDINKCININCSIKIIIILLQK